MTYPYYDVAKRSLEFDVLLDHVRSAPRSSVFVLQACCHNPTGIDLSQAQWIELASILKEYGQFPFMDIAYQGFGNGMTDDAFPIHHFVKQGLEMVVSLPIFFCCIILRVY